MSNAETLIHAFMTSRLDYCNALLGGCFARLINKLQLVQNAAARVLTRTSKYEHIRVVFYKVPPSDKRSLLWLALIPTGTVHCDWPNTTSPVGNVTPLSIIVASAFKIKVKTVNNVLSFTISSSPRGEQSHVTDTMMKLVCVCTQAAVKMISEELYTPLWCDPLSLSLSLSLSLTHTHKPRLR